MYLFFKKMGDINICNFCLEEKRILAFFKELRYFFFLLLVFDICVIDICVYYIGR